MHAHAQLHLQRSAKLAAWTLLHVLVPAALLPQGVEDSAGGMRSAGSLAPTTAIPLDVYDHPIPASKRRWMVVLFAITAALLFADQNLLAPNVSDTALIHIAGTQSVKRVHVPPVFLCAHVHGTVALPCTEQGAVRSWRGVVLVGVCW